MSDRKRLTKETREKVYAKYGGRCAYCGCEIAYKDMQVDHIVAFENGGKDEMDNYNPSCRMCNFYKRTYNLESFRQRVSTIPERLENGFIYRLAKNYGIVEEHEKLVRFYFEREDEE